jgi:hypothetical protein
MSESGPKPTFRRDRAHLVHTSVRGCHADFSFCCGEDDFASGRDGDGRFDRPPPSNECHQLTLGIGIAVDVSLGCLDRAMAR